MGHIVGAPSRTDASRKPPTWELVGQDAVEWAGVQSALNTLDAVRQNDPLMN